MSVLPRHRYKTASATPIPRWCRPAQGRGTVRPQHTACRKVSSFFGGATSALSEFGLRLMLRYAAQGTEGGRGGIRCPLSRCPNHTNLRKIKNVGLFN